MKKAVINEIIWLLISVVTFGLWALLAETKDIFYIGMLEYIGLTFAKWIGKIDTYESIRKN